jgi:hypothetical protein
MLFRLLTAAIILFWITMTALLVRSEMWPNQSALRTVPIEHVAKLLWKHEQPSNLTIWSEGARVGHFALHPIVRKEDEARLLEYSGNLQLRLPGVGLQRLSWDGIAEFDQVFDLRSLLLGIGQRQREPSTMRHEILFIPAQHLARYSLKNDRHELESHEYSLDETGLKQVLEQLAFDPALFEAFRGSNTAAPVMTAQVSSMTIHNDRVETYLVTVQQGGQTLLETHVSQLGQFLFVKSLIGYTMAPEDVVP